MWGLNTAPCRIEKKDITLPIAETDVITMAQVNIIVSFQIRPSPGVLAVAQLLHLGASFNNYRTRAWPVGPLNQCKVSRSFATRGRTRKRRAC